MRIKLKTSVLQVSLKEFKKKGRETWTYKCILFAESWLRRKWLLRPNLYFSSWRSDERYELEKNQLEQHIGNFLLLLLISIGLRLLSSDWLKTKTKTIALAHDCNRHKRHNEPIRIRRHYLDACSSFKRASYDKFSFCVSVPGSEIWQSNVRLK